MLSDLDTACVINFSEILASEGSYKLSCQYPLMDYAKTSDVASYSEASLAQIIAAHLIDKLRG